MMAKVSSLPREVGRLVTWSLQRLGKAIEEVYGREAFLRIEQIRIVMGDTFGKDNQALNLALMDLQQELSILGKTEIYQIAQSFSLMMELINVCETAYRIHRINQKEEKIYLDKPKGIHYVLTAHPTEARTNEFLKLFKEIRDYLVQILNSPYRLNENHFDELLKTSLQIKISYHEKPSVQDEAHYIYQYALKPHNMELYHSFLQKEIPVQLRTWVGGDKDGHSGVDDKIMVKSLELSRSFFIAYIQDCLKKVLELFQTVTILHKNKSLDEQLHQLIKNSRRLGKIQAGDHQTVVAFKNELVILQTKINQYLKFEPEQLTIISSLFQLYPALVIPLELREDAAIVSQSLTANKKTTITRMLERVAVITQGTDPKNYIRGFILSMVESAQDISNGISLVKKVFNTYALPVVPLFENHKALSQADTILKQAITDEVKQKHKTQWEGNYEVMLGYSDSSKENGVFPSRLMIARSLKNIELTLDKLTLHPVFFHGSGGSVERGGGDIKEQTAFWSKAVMSDYKATIQGEMVARLFGSSTIFKSQVDKFLEIYAQKDQNTEDDYPLELDAFAKSISQKYKELVESEWFWTITEQASPYHFLSELKIGSRPSKRQAGPEQRKLRAIPWILCWTQTRLLFPTWWGVGSAWLALHADDKKKLKAIYKKNSLFSAFVKQLGVTLSKVYLPVWEQYLYQFTVSNQFLKPFQSELDGAILFFQQITGEKDFCFHQPWLGESIQLRSTLLHPLNLIQIEAMKRKDYTLLRKTVTGISCGMLTTG